jgi:serine/threonine-protein kinase
MSAAPSSTDQNSPYQFTRTVPSHLSGWQLPQNWQWGPEGVAVDHRHYQEVIDALGRSLSLVSVPDPAHEPWLFAEARNLAHLSHPSVPTTYHYWTHHREGRRGPGYLRRWIGGETVGARLRRSGAGEIASVMQVLRGGGSALAYLHDAGTVHGAVGPDNVWTIPSGRLWLIGWQWAVGKEFVPSGLVPDRRWMPATPEWGDDGWVPDTASDQWQLAALCYATLVGELPPERDIPPVRWVRPDCPQGLAALIDRALDMDPAQRYHTITAMLRALDRMSSARTAIFVGGDGTDEEVGEQSEETRLRWAVGDDYDVLSRLGSGSFGSVWRVRDLTLEREVALKMLHEHIARDESAVTRFQREARLAAQLAHPGIVPIHDWDSRAEVSWYTMELAEGGSVAQLIAQHGARPITDVASQVDLVLDAMAAAHAVGVIHRDLKPENVLIDRYRRWRLADFGIAKMTGEDVRGTTGSPQFAAPEQLLGELQGPAVDLFAVAAIVYFALVGRPPFTGDDGRAILAQQLSGELSYEGIHDSVADWIRKGLNPEPEQRFADAVEMRTAWRAAVKDAQRHARSRRWWKALWGGA